MSLNYIEPIKILCPGGFTWNNKGDAALIICMLEEVRKKIGNVNFTVLSDTPELDSNKYQERFLPMPFHTFAPHRQCLFSLRLGCPQTCTKIYDRYIGWRFGGKFSATSLQYLLKTSLSKIKKTFSSHRLTIVKFYLSVFYLITAYALLKNKMYIAFPAATRNILKEFSRANGILFIPGGYFIAPHCGHVHWLRHAYPLIIARLTKKPTALYACSIGPFIGWHNQWLASKVLNLADLIVLREKESLKTLKSLNINHPQIHVTADAAFTLKASALTPDVCQLNTQISACKKLKIGVSIRPYDFPEDADPPSKINNYHSSIAQLVDYLITQFEAHIFFMPQCTAPGMDDRTTVNAVLSYLTCSSSQIHIINGDYSPQELKQLYSLMDVFVGVRMHANIFALSNLTPVLAIAYEPKTLGIMKMLGLEEFVIEISQVNANDLIQKLNKLINNREKITYQLKQVIPQIQKQAAYSADIVCQLFHRKGIYRDRATQ